VRAGHVAAASNSCYVSRNGVVFSALTVDF